MKFKNLRFSIASLAIGQSHLLRKGGGVITYIRIQNYICLLYGYKIYNGVGTVGVKQIL